MKNTVHLIITLLELLRGDLNAVKTTLFLPLFAFSSLRSWAMRLRKDCDWKKKSLFLPLFRPLATTLLLSVGVGNLSAQSGTVIASGFTGISGIEADADGNLWVCEVGTGNDDSQVSVIRPDGSIDLFLTGLPSVYDSVTEETAGTWRTYQLANNEVAIVTGEGDAALAGSILIADKDNWTPGTPLTTADVTQLVDVSTYVLGQGYAESNPYSMALDGAGRYIIADAAANALLRYDPAADTIGVLAEFPPFPNPLPFGPPFVDAVPTKVVAKAGGGFYVCQLTGFPFVTGAAKVFEVTETGEMSVFADDLTLLTDMHYDPADDALTVLQFAAFDNGFQLNSAQIIKLYSDGSRDTLVSDFGPSPSFTFDDASNIYATHLFFGQVIKFDAVTAVLEEDIPELTEVEIFPNPSTGQINVQYESTESTSLWIELYDALGRLVEVREVAQSPVGMQNLRWDLGGGQLQQGYYQLRLRTAQGQVTEQVLVLPR